MPRWSRRNTVRNPDRPMVARNAKARVTPPNWASTPEAAVTTRRSTPPGLAVTRAYASRAPKIAPMIALTADSTMLRPNASSTYPWVRALMLASVTPPSPANAPITTTRVGMIRKTSTYAKKGTVPISAAPRRRGRTATRCGVVETASANGLGPVRRQVLLGLGGLLLAQEDRRAVHGGQRRERGLVDRAGLLHGVGPHGPGAALQPQGLTLVGEEELLPQARGGRVRGILVDRLHVVRAEYRARRHDRLPGLQLGGLGDVEVVPVQHDRGLPGLDGRRGGVHRQEVAGLLQLAEEGDARRDVVGRAAVLERGHHHAGERGAGLGRVAVERHLALVGGLEQVLDAGGRGHLGAVVADRHVAAVVVDPGATRVLQGGGDVAEGGHLVRRELGDVGTGHRAAQVEDVRCGALPLQLVGGVDLVLAGAVRLGRIHLDAVLVAEGLDDLAVVRPVRWQGDDVELALLLGGGEQRLHAAEVVDAGRGRGAGGRGFALLLRRGTGRDRGYGGGRQGDGDRAGEDTHCVPPSAPRDRCALGGSWKRLVAARRPAGVRWATFG